MDNCRHCGRVMDEFDCCFTCDTLGTPEQQREDKASRRSPCATKGPWVWADFGGGHSLVTAHSGSKVVLDAVRAGQRGACLRLRTTDDGPSLMIPFDPQHPDARLLAAAPQLRRALRDLLDLVDFVTAWDVPSPAKRDICIANAREILAEVEGNHHDV